MSSWVAPAVAAEIWGCSVEHVLEAAASGQIPSCRDGEFMFVDASAGSPSGRPRTYKLRPEDHDELAQSIPSNEAAVTAEEIAALGCGPDRTDGESDDLVPVPDEPGGPDISQWRNMRIATARLRWPPRAAI